METSAPVVVIAEDEMLVRTMAAEVLIEAGFEVIEAAHAAEALDVLHSRGAAIQVLFTDIQMPGAMNGLALAHHVRGNWPWIALLVTSGAMAPRSEELPRESRFLPKPYRFDQVLLHVRALIGGDSSA